MKSKFNPISKAEFLLRLKQRPTENLDLIRTIEAQLKKQRGYVYRAPTVGDNVILLLSGGLDSITAWGLLLDEYKYKVYPLYLNRDKHVKEREWATIRYFCKYYRDRYPDLFVDPYEFSASSLIPELEKEKLRTDYLHPHRIIELYGRQKQQRLDYAVTNGLPFSFVFYGAAYATHLFDHQNIKIKTIFNAICPSDGIEVLFQTFTSLRMALMALNTIMPEKDWQYSSVLFEKETGTWIEKNQLIRWAAKHQIPLEKTWSCYGSGRYHCGSECVSCRGRRYYFGLAGVIDKTTYAFEIRQQRKDFFKKLLQYEKWMKYIKRSEA